ncbi:acetyltransferase [Streptococcus cristatus]|uniref:N-acetyltransferase n=2 Tax=Streptococcus cristatus TaxID=45634 RepID=A0A512A9X0_STRCR|nr:GNAT family N-acetyltransferase [Streptococcus cristatus]AGK70830.1 acetyltransferase [Streptococcus cristatus AS 1.3089]GEN96498.1 N-acetyltransferase [Streptococcus cristatus]SQI47058.1 acetyltransferase [Streptococcus cristatus]
MTVKIRKVNETDMEKLLPLYEALGYPVDKDELQSRLKNILANPAYGCLVAEKESQLLGFIGYVKLQFFETSDSYYRILALSVSPTARREGVATALMDKVKKLATENGAKALALNSSLTDVRQAAYQFYENYGFEKVTTGFAMNLENNE